MTDDHELSRHLTALVASTPGVVEVYSSASTLQTLPALPLALLPDGLLPEGLLPDRLLPSNLVPTGVAPDEKVAVSRTSTGSLTVTATIGVGGGHSVLETVRLVSDALREYLEAIEPSRGTPSEPPVIHVRVSRVDSAQVP
jgi:hypothetical protein